MDQTLQPYAYAEDDPTNAIDPEGGQAWKRLPGLVCATYTETKLNLTSSRAFKAKFCAIVRYNGVHVEIRTHAHDPGYVDCYVNPAEAAQHAIRTTRRFTNITRLRRLQHARARKNGATPTIGPRGAVDGASSKEDGRPLTHSPRQTPRQDTWHGRKMST